MQDRNTSIDIAKYVAALMVIAIHTALLSDVNADLGYFVTQVMTRLAVPFFAICTGYFMGKKLLFDETGRLTACVQNQLVFIRRWRNIALLYGIWSVLYLIFSIPMWIQIGWFSPMAFVDFAIASVTIGSHYHLWYLLFLLYSLPIVYVLLRMIACKYHWLLVGFLWLIAIFLYVYNAFFPTLTLPESLELLKRFTMMPILPALILLGVMISRKQIRGGVFMLLYRIVFAHDRRSICITAFGD